MFSSSQPVNKHTRGEAQSSLNSANTQSPGRCLPSTDPALENSSNRSSSHWTKAKAESPQTFAPASILLPNSRVSDVVHSSALGVPSMETGSRLATNQGATFAANQPLSAISGVHKRVSCAKADFADFLQEEKFPGHYLSNNSPDGPRRRKDGDDVISEARVRHIHESFDWDTDKNRWTFGSNGMIVTEGQIYDVILRYQRSLPRTHEPRLFHAISRSVKGILRNDIKRAAQLWSHHQLGDLNLDDDSLWGSGPRAVSKCT